MHQARDERTYHIFYQLCAGADRSLRGKFTSCEVPELSELHVSMDVNL